MGWKAIKEHYGIKGSVHYGFQDQNILEIRGPSLQGVLRVSRSLENMEGHGWSNFPDVERQLLEQFRADPALFEQLWAQEDRFGPSIALYGVSDREILEDACEVYAEGEVTHKGRLIYGGLGLRPDKGRAVSLLLHNLLVGIDHNEQFIEEYKPRLDAARERLTEMRDAFAEIARAEPEHFKQFNQQLAERQAQAESSEEADN